MRNPTLLVTDAAVRCIQYLRLNIGIAEARKLVRIQLIQLWTGLRL